MVTKNQNIKYVNQDCLKSYEFFCLIDCLIDTIDLMGVFELNIQLKIENCIINNLRIHSCWFVKGLILKNCVVRGYVDYQMGGHNNDPIIIEGNVFTEFLNFFDCHFVNNIELRNNVFIKGTNLLGNKGEGFENSFIEGWLVENNIGNVSVNGVS